MKALLLAVILASSAQFANGEIMSGDYEIELVAFPTLNQSGPFTVPGGESLALNGSGASADFNFTAGNSSILTLSVSGVGVGGVGSDIDWVFSNLNIILAPTVPGRIGSVVFNAAASTPGVVVSSQGFTDDSITIRTEDFAASSFDFSFRVTAIPEPTHFAILAVVCVGFILFKRRSPLSA